MQITNNLQIPLEIHLITNRTNPLRSNVPDTSLFDKDTFFQRTSKVQSIFDDGEPKFYPMTIYPE
jgi:hypothetical protein